MELEKRKILEMVKDGIITVEEADKLLKILEDSEKNKKSPFKDKVKEELLKTKEELSQIKDKLKQEYEKIDFSSAKDKIKVGLEKLEKAMKKIDDAIYRYSEKIFKKNTKVDNSEQPEVKEVDPLTDENVSFLDKNK